MIRKMIHLALVVLMFVSQSFAQQIDLKQLSGMGIRNIGPAGMSGRVTAIDVNLKDPSEIFVGTASGGLWKSGNGGISWKPVFDEQPTLSIGSVAINPQNPSVVWAGTGEGNPRNSHNSGKGIFRSLDGGKSWTQMGLENTYLLHRVRINPHDPDIIYAAALGSAWGPNPDRGVFRSRDGGKTWKKILYVNEQTGCGELVMDPSNPNKLIASMWEYGRKPWTFNSGGPGSGIYITYDGGDNWERIDQKDGLPKGDLGRIGLAIAPGKSQIVYALVEARENGLYKSKDGGHHWELISTAGGIGNRPFYYSEIYVDPANENRIFSLWTRLSTSEDGGKTWEQLGDGNWYSGIHPDHHAFWIHPSKPEFIIEGNDGGLNISHDGGHSWRFVDNLPVSQFYHINYDMEIPYNLGGGMQDNGTWVGPSEVWQYGGIKNFHWQEVLFGDGFDLVFKPGENRYAFAMSQGGELHKVDQRTGKATYIKPVSPAGDQLRFNWDAALAQDPFNSCGLFFGSQYLHYSDNCGESWTLLSPDLTTNDPTKQQQDKSGGLTPDVTDAENFTTIVCIAPSPANRNVIWVGTDDGNLQLTEDRGTTWQNLSGRLPGLPQGAWIHQIEVNKVNPQEAFVAINDYRRNNPEPYLYHTDNMGKSWRRLADSRKVEGHCWSIVQDPVETDLLFLGTEQGLYVSLDRGGNWNKWTNDFPNVSTRDLKIHERDDDLLIGTFGRSAWILDDIQILRAIARTKGRVLQKPFAVFKAPTAYLATYKSVQAGRFVADGSFTGENKRSGATLTVWKKPMETAASDEETEKDPGDEKDKKKAGEKDKVTVFVMTETGDTIRTFRTKVDTCVSRIHWNLRRDGALYPSRRDREPEEMLPSGEKVAPGLYKLVLEHQDWKDSTFLTVVQDPRLPFDPQRLQKIAGIKSEYERLVRLSQDGFEKIKEVRKTLDLTDGFLVNTADSLKTVVTEREKELRDTLKALELEFLAPEESKGYQRHIGHVTWHLYRVSQYLNASESDPTQMALLSMLQAREKIMPVLRRVNRFLNEDWAGFQELIRDVQTLPFKEIQTLPIDE